MLNISNVSAITSPYIASNAAFFTFSSCYYIKISSYSASGKSGILATVNNSSINAVLYYFINII